MVIFLGKFDYYALRKVEIVVYRSFVSVKIFKIEQLMLFSVIKPRAGALIVLPGVVVRFAPCVRTFNGRRKTGSDRCVNVKLI